MPCGAGVVAAFPALQFIDQFLRRGHALADVLSICECSFFRTMAFLFLETSIRATLVHLPTRNNSSALSPATDERAR